MKENIQPRNQPLWPIVLNSVASPFRSRQSLLRLVIGAMPSMFFWWAKSNGSLALIGIGLLLCFPPAAYSVRVIRAAIKSRDSGIVLELPPWLGPPADLFKALAASAIGTFTVLAPVAMILVAMSELVIILVTGHPLTSFGPDSVLAIWQELQSNAGDVVATLSLPVYALALWLVLFIPVMLVHYAIEDRFLAIFEWRRISSIVLQHFWQLLSLELSMLLIVSLLNAAFHQQPILLSMIGFAADVITWSLIAQVCVVTNPYSQLR
jgi:hypothetical protein